ncbi:hypothetical protein quinque_015918 [Culex quinquefasciatus]
MLRARTKQLAIQRLCEEQNCQEEVSLLCLSYMDRFLSLVPIKKTHLQILATACLLLASKLREPNYKALPVELLVFYTDHSITKKDLIVSYIVFVIAKLGWAQLYSCAFCPKHP